VVIRGTPDALDSCMLVAGTWLFVLLGMLVTARYRPASTLAVGALASTPLFVRPDLAVTPLGAIAVGVAVGAAVWTARRVHVRRKHCIARAELPLVR
jgi:hypothetical protein